MRRLVVVDTSLLLLLIVGLLDKKLIARHKKLSGFDVNDFDCLTELIDCFDDLIYTPHLLTEISNLAAFVAEPDRTRLRKRLRRLIRYANEEVLPSRLAVLRPEVIYLGLTDAVLLELSELRSEEREIALLTADTNLYVAALTVGIDVINFNEENPHRNPH